MLDLFKTQARREREAIRDAVIEAIVKSEAAAKAEINLLESALEPADRVKALTRLVNVLLGCERTEKDVAIWQSRADALKARGHLHDALGANLGARLVACAVLLLHLEGRDLRAASVPFARLEQLLHALVAPPRRRSLAGSPTLEHMAFEKYRLAHAPIRNVDEALASTQPETTTMAYVSMAMPPESERAAFAQRVAGDPAQAPPRRSRATR
jgi:hypothetical protein